MFTLTLRALPRWLTRFNPTPREQRLRTALKRLLRDYGLRCLAAAPGTVTFRSDELSREKLKGLYE